MICAFRIRLGKEKSLFAQSVREEEANFRFFILNEISFESNHGVSLSAVAKQTIFRRVCNDPPLLVWSAHSIFRRKKCFDF